MNGNKDTKPGLKQIFFFIISCNWFVSCKSIRASQVNKIIHSGCACFCFPSFVDSHHGHVISTNLNVLSRPSLIELFSRGTKFRSGFLSMLSIKEAHLSALFTRVSQLQDENQVGFSSWLTNHHLCHHCWTTTNPLCTLNMLRKVTKQTCLLQPALPEANFLFTRTFPCSVAHSTSPTFQTIKTIKVFTHSF
jgi:hypothetical protein